MGSGTQRVALQVSGKKVSTQVKYIHPSRHTAVIIGRLRLGKRYLNAYLHQIGKHQDGLCNHCNKLETVSHFLTECSHSPTCLAVLAACKRLNLAPTLGIILSDSRLHNTIVSSPDRKLQCCEFRGLNHRYISWLSYLYKLTLIIS